jgi:hypothetical protein
MNAACACLEAGVTLEGGHGHLDGVVSMKQAEKKITEFLAK